MCLPWAALKIDHTPLVKERRTCNLSRRVRHRKWCPLPKATVDKVSRALNHVLQIFVFFVEIKGLCKNYGHREGTLCITSKKAPSTGL